MNGKYFVNLKRFFEVKRPCFWRWAGRVCVLSCMAVTLFSACSVGDSVEGDDITPPVPVIDVTPPTIKVLLSTVDITGVEEIRISGNELSIGSKLVASWSDNVTKNCMVQMTFDGVSVSSGNVPDKSGTLTLTVTDQAGNKSTASVSLKMEEIFPDLSILMPEVNVFGGSDVAITDTQLLIGGEVVAEWKDKYTQQCKVTLALGTREVKDGDVLDEPGKLVLTVTNDRGKSSKAEITLISEAIIGEVKIDDMQVDKEVDLLAHITFAPGVELLKVETEQDGQRTEIADPHAFTPEYPGTLTLVFTVKSKSGSIAEVTVDNLTVKPLDYSEAKINDANMIQEKYPWYNNIQQTTKDFIYPHLIASYAACNWSRLDNRVHIIMGETTDASDVENIGQYSVPDDHAYEGYYRIRALSPDVSIKGCDDYWYNLEEYINQHPDKVYFISQAAGSAGGRDWEELINNPETAPQKRLLENENIINICGGGNWGPSGWKTYNENIKDGDYYIASATNSKKNNKITVTGYNSWGENNYFSPRYSVYGGLRSAMPIGFDKDKGNIVMPMVPLIYSNNQEDQNTTSSYPTAVTSGVIGNAVSVIMANHPGITAEDAMTIIVNNYLIQEKFQYKDETTNWELVDGDYWYFIDIQKLLKAELLQSDKTDEVEFNSDLVELPSGNGICYTGQGIQFEYEGNRYDVTSENQSILIEALQSGNVNWYWNKDSFRKYGGTNSVSIDVYVVDKNGDKIPTLHNSITKNVI